MKKAWAIVKRTVRGFIADDALSLGGALAFYTALSMAPLLVLVLALAGFVWQEGEVRLQIIRQVYFLIGPSGADMVAVIMRDAGQSRSHGVAAVVGIVTLLFSATGAFAQLQYSLNRVWNVEARPGRDVADFLRRRLLSLGMILAVAFLLVVSLVVSAALSFLASWTHVALPGGERTWKAVDFVASLLVFVGIFTLMHHTLPDVKMRWKDSLLGGAATAVLFLAGKEVLGWYLGSMSPASSYGAASSFFVVLLWVYFSSLILFVGAELTQAFTEEMGHEVRPNRYARFVKSPA